MCIRLGFNCEILRLPFLDVLYTSILQDIAVLTLDKPHAL
jgi:hypothetical protein